MQQTRQSTPPEVHVLDPYFADDRPWPLVPLRKKEKFGWSKDMLKKRFGASAPDNYLKMHLTEKQAKELYAEGYNIGLACGDGVCVIDVDPRNFPKDIRSEPGAGPAYTIGALKKLGFGGSFAQIVRTGGGGIHLLARQNETISLPKDLPGYPGIEIKTSSHVVTAGCVHPNGKIYRWEKDTRFVCLDDAPDLSEKFYAFVSKQLAEAGNTKKKKSFGRKVSSQNIGVVSEDELTAILNCINPIPLSDHEWWSVQAAAKSALGDDAYSSLDRWNQRDPKRYDQKTNELRFESIDIDGAREAPKITFATLMFMARQEGGRPANDLCDKLRQKWFEGGWNDELASDADLAADVVEAVTRDWSPPEVKARNGKKTWLEEMNLGFAHVIIGGKAKIMRFTEDGSLRDYIETAAFRSLFRNQIIEINGEKQTKANAWLAHPNRREYDGVDFVPGGETPPGTFNLFTGFGSKPDANASCDKFLNHLRNVICEDNEEGFEYLIRWMAHAIQNPGEKPGVAVILKGKKGVGKDTVAKYFARTIGKKYCTTLAQSTHLTGRFQSHLEQTLLVSIEEGSWAGHRKDEEALKHLLTADEMLIERKGIEAYSIRSSSRFIISTNADWAVPATDDERRFAVFDTKSERKAPNYYSEIYEELENGGADALHHFLLSLDLSEFEVRYAPNSNGLVAQKIASLKGFQKFWFECLYSRTHPGWHPKQLKENSAKWETDELIISKTSLRDAYDERYQRSVQRSEYRFHAIGENQFKRHLVDVCPELRETRSENDFNKSVRCFVIPNLGECRLAFESFLGGEIDWGDW